MDKKLIGNVSWGDNIDPDHPVADGWVLNTPENIEKAMQRWRNDGFSKLYWRIDTVVMQRYFENRNAWVQMYNPRFFQVLSETLERMDPLACAVESGHQAGLEVYPRIDIFFDGCPEHVLQYTWRSTEPKPCPYQSHFTVEHPEYLAVDRGGRSRHWGVLELAYPEVREYKLGLIKEFSEGYDADGVFLYVPTHDTPVAYYGDQYGFNQPVVEEYERRYGMNILKGDFDLEKWRRLRGEYLTQFFREVKEYLRKSGKKLGLALHQGDYIGPPYGNLYQDWRTWVEEGIVDELCVGIVVDNYQHYTPIDNGYGYLCNPYFDVGINPLEQDIKEVYGPICGAYGCDLYVPPVEYDRSLAKGVPISQERYDRLLDIRELDGLFLGAWELTVDPERAADRAERRAKMLAVREAKVYGQLLERHATMLAPS